LQIVHLMCASTLRRSTHLQSASDRGFLSSSLNLADEEDRHPRRDTKAAPKDG
jgi:hypothetical protein